MLLPQSDDQVCYFSKVEIAVMKYIPDLLAHCIRFMRNNLILAASNYSLITESFNLITSNTILCVNAVLILASVEDQGPAVNCIR